MTETNDNVLEFNEKTVSTYFTINSILQLTEALIEHCLINSQTIKYSIRSKHLHGVESLFNFLFYLHIQI